MIFGITMFVRKGEDPAMTAPYNWYESYTAAVLETDWEKIHERIDVAESAMHERQRVLSEDHGGTAAEKQALFVALNGIKCLRRDVARWQHRHHGFSDRARTQRLA